MMVLLKVLKYEVNANGMKRVENQPFFFLNLEKTNAKQGTVNKFEINNKEIDNPVEIKKKLKRVFGNLFKRKLRKTKQTYNKFLRDISLPTLSQEEKKALRQRN